MMKRLIDINNKDDWPYFRKRNNYLGDCDFCTRPLRQGDCSNSRIISGISICCSRDCKQKLEKMDKTDELFSKIENVEKVEK